MPLGIWGTAILVCITTQILMEITHYLIDKSECKLTCKTHEYKSDGSIIKREEMKELKKPRSMFDEGEMDEQVNTWCNENEISMFYTYKDDFIICGFLNDEDATLFKLTWA